MPGRNDIGFIVLVVVDVLVILVGLVDAVLGMTVEVVLLAVLLTTVAVVDDDDDAEDIMGRLSSIDDAKYNDMTERRINFRIRCDIGICITKQRHNDERLDVAIAVAIVVVEVGMRFVSIMHLSSLTLLMNVSSESSLLSS